MISSLKQRMRKKILPWFFGYLLKGIVKLIGSTCFFRFEIKDFHQAAASSPSILIFWHNRLGMIAEILKRLAPQYRYVALTSNSRDGEIISVIVNSYRQGRALRVAHNKKHQALLEAIKNLKKGNEILIITPDGPRGPLYQIKPGVVLAAKKSSACVIPLTWNANRVWRFKTWDQLMLPKPFATVTVKIGSPIHLQDNGIDPQEEAIILKESLYEIEENNIIE